MHKKVLIALFMSLIIVISGCAGDAKIDQSNDQPVKTQTQSSGNVGVPKEIEQYVGKPIDDLANAVGAEPTVNYWNIDEKGIAQNGDYHFTGDFLLHGNLVADFLLADILGNTTMYIASATVALPYENKPGIQKGDDEQTVKKKIMDAGFEFEVEDGNIIYIDGQYSYCINMHNDAATQFLVTSVQEEAYAQIFERYCKALPGGHYLSNGDYMVATPEGLIQIMRNEYGYIKRGGDTAGTLEMTDKGLVFTLEVNEKKYAVNNDSGDLTLFADEVVAPAQTQAPVKQNPILVQYKDDVRKYQEYTLDKWGYSTTRFFDVADFNNDGTLELFSINNLSSPTPGTLRQAKLEVFTIRDGEVVFRDSFSATEPMLQGGTDFYNYYIGSVPGEGDYLVIDHVNTRMGSGHSISVGRITGTYTFEEVDSVEFAYPNMDLANGELITDYPRAAELLGKYGVCYDNLLIGLDQNYGLLFGYSSNQGGNSSDHLQKLISGDNDSEILFILTGERP